MTRPVVLLLTAAHLPGLAADDQPLLEAFRRAGWDPRPTVWSGPIPDGDLAIIRSCWDYTDWLDDFLATVDGVAERMPIWNPPATVRWNAHKRYLLDLPPEGVSIAASRIVTPSDRVDPVRLANHLGSDDLVVKPVIGASGRGVSRVGAGDTAAWHRAVAGREVLVQPFLPEVLSDGEWSLMYFHGRFSHAVIKRARAGEFRVQQEHGGTAEVATPDHVVRDGADRALAAVPHPWHYARVDGVVHAGRFVLMELELIEPQLFLVDGDAADRLVP